MIRGAAFTVMVVGESGLGKTTFINTLFSTTIKNYAEHRLRHKKQMDKTVSYRSSLGNEWLLIPA